MYINRVFSSTIPYHQTVPYFSKQDKLKIIIASIALAIFIGVAIWSCSFCWRGRKIISDTQPAKPDLASKIIDSTKKDVQTGEPSEVKVNLAGQQTILNDEKKELKEPSNIVPPEEKQSEHHAVEQPGESPIEIHDPFTDLSCPSTFRVAHDADLRLFHIRDDKNVLGTIVSSGYGILDFYDSQNQKLFQNIEDELFDTDGKCIGSVWVVSDHVRDPSCWWFQHSDNCGSTRIDFHSDIGEHLFYMELEGSGVLFRDAVTNLPLAVALWKDVLAKRGILANTYSKEWSFILTDAQRLQERNILRLHLIWALMKHIQKTLEGPYQRLPYVADYPNKPAT